MIINRRGLKECKEFFFFEITVGKAFLAEENVKCNS